VVDGHDFGSGEMNIFVHSDDPAASFAIVRKEISTETLGLSLRAAYRDFAGDRYTTIWPPENADPFAAK
jgi:hypothetical protein